MTTSRAWKSAPGPVGSPWLFFLPNRLRVVLSQTRAFVRNPLDHLLQSARQHGDIACLDPGRVYLINRPEFIQYVLQDNHANYCKGSSYQFYNVFGIGLLVSDGEVWRRQRRLVQPAFGRKHDEAFVTIMIEATNAMMTRWAAIVDRGVAVDIRQEMSRLTLSVFLKAMFSAEAGEELDDVARAFLIVERSLNPSATFLPIQWPKNLPTPGQRRVRQAIAALDSFVYRLIDERRRSGERTGDLLSRLLDARDEETGEGLSRQQVRDQTLTLMNAGHELTTDAMTWTWYLLSKHSTVARRLHDEIDELLASRAPALPDVSKLTYTSMVIQESMRLYPPVWGLGRTAIQADQIGGYDIPAGAFVAISPYVMHRSEAYWENPEGFDPDRFSPARAAARHRFEYFPFGGGQRMCIGMGYALIETQLVILMVSQKYRIDLVAGQHIEAKPHLSLKPSTSVWMTIHTRQSSGRSEGARANPIAQQSP